MSLGAGHRACCLCGKCTTCHQLCCAALFIHPNFSSSLTHIHTHTLSHSLTHSLSLSLSLSRPGHNQAATTCWMLRLALSLALLMPWLHRSSCRRLLRRARGSTAHRCDGCVWWRTSRACVECFAVLACLVLCVLVWFVHYTCSDVSDSFSELKTNPEERERECVCVCVCSSICLSVCLFLSFSVFLAACIMSASRCICAGEGSRHTTTTTTTTTTAVAVLLRLNEAGCLPDVLWPRRSDSQRLCSRRVQKRH